jgi:hypothetical protein
MTILTILFIIFGVVALLILATYDIYQFITNRDSLFSNLNIIINVVVILFLITGVIIFVLLNYFMRRSSENEQEERVSLPDPFSDGTWILSSYGTDRVESPGKLLPIDYSSNVSPEEDTLERRQAEVDRLKQTSHDEILNELQKRYKEELKMTPEEMIENQKKRLTEAKLKFDEIKKRLEDEIQAKRMKKEAEIQKLMMLDQKILEESKDKEEQARMERERENERKRKDDEDDESFRRVLQEKNIDKIIFQPEDPLPFGQKQETREEEMKKNQAELFRKSEKIRAERIAEADRLREERKTEEEEQKMLEERREKAKQFRENHQKKMIEEIEEARDILIETVRKLTEKENELIEAKRIPDRKEEEIKKIELDKWYAEEIVLKAERNLTKLIDQNENWDKMLEEGMGLASRANAMFCNPPTFKVL